MITTVPEADRGRTLSIEENDGNPASVFLTVADARTGHLSTCVEFERAALVTALCRHFGLISQSALFLNFAEALDALDDVDSNVVRD